MSTMADKEFLQDAKKQRLTITPKRGENMQALIGNIHRTPKAVVERAIKAMTPH
jgi:hypothetical protein